MARAFRVTGSFKNTYRFLRTMKEQRMFDQLEAYAREGVSALQAYTPIESGLTADSWTYEITDGENVRIAWNNSNINQGVNIAIILQYGHGTGTGGYVEGRDYINPAIQPIFDKISERVWRAVTNA